ncbi:MAG: M48 family metallopeptidase [Bacteroidales bacterium]|nr:M48 family metallopeptidase [Bacteroidales bacterium]MDD2322876.1 M48 family metallopeptidase [Bacteroidales bacterium]MDD3009837.1 M48 family metallopeptidase [Bacteroidales bacterium]MDD3961386.1 M48 family metallopeptidase [Bacteroidales bacterium]MDY0286281.1 M48 family metallopeptidase [Bacteroidales bacterium]
MKRKISVYAAAVVVITVFYSCSTVPFTNRKQINVLPSSMMLEMSLTSYDQFLSENPPMGADTKEVQQVKKVGTDIASAVDAFLKENGMDKRLKEFDWEFNVVQDETVNAWCMPGGKIVFYSGILPVTENNEGIAVVMGHEIAHALARHGNERMSQQLAVELGGMTLSVALQEKPELTQQIFLTSYGIGSTLGSLAYSRKHEYEADRIGMILMAKAGYDPNHAIAFWEKMSAQGGPNQPEFLSTHPSDENRIKAMKKNLPEAMKHLQGTKPKPVKM